MLKNLLKTGKENVDHFFEHLDLQVTEMLLHKLFQCKGTLFFTGVGKSESMARKIAVTMASTGTKAMFMAPTNALHGDIGLISANDMVLLLSKSGETEELLNLVPYIHQKGAQTVAIVSDSSSRLSRLCNLSISLPLAKELCPYNLVPTTSTQIQMIFGDLLTVALMQLKKFGMDQYAENHPSGKIGRRITTKVHELMLTGPALPLCHPNDKTLDILVQLSQKRCGCVLIVDETSKLLGIFTDGDLGRTLNSYGPQGLELPIKQHMSHHPRSIAPDKLAWEAMQLMEKDPTHPITVLAVTDQEHHLIGLIKLHDILLAGI